MQTQPAEGGLELATDGVLFVLVAGGMTARAGSSSVTDGKWTWTTRTPQLAAGRGDHMATRTVMGTRVSETVPNESLRWPDRRACQQRSVVSTSAFLCFETQLQDLEFCPEARGVTVSFRINRKNFCLGGRGPSIHYSARHPGNRDSYVSSARQSLRREEMDHQRSIVAFARCTTKNY